MAHCEPQKTPPSQTYYNPLSTLIILNIQLAS
jgi:hypothetical protein